MSKLSIRNIGPALMFIAGMIIGCGSDNPFADICGVDGAPDACGNPCSGDENCGGGTFCSGGQCIAECMEGIAGCPSGQECNPATGRCADADTGVGCELENPPATCGDPCTVAEDCGDKNSGTFCHIDTCASDCKFGDNRCPEGQTCSTRGQCESDDNCSAVQISPERQIPNIIFILDHSTSMNRDFANRAADDSNFTPPSRWNAVMSAMIGDGVSTGLFYRLQSVARLGLAAYSIPGNQSYTDGGGPGGADSNTCAELELAPASLSLAQNNANALKTKLQGIPTGGSTRYTPTGEAIYEIDGLLTSNPPPEGKTVYVLATDGIPNGCDHDEEESDKVHSKDAVKEAYNHGRPTFVIGVAFQDAHLQDLANAGANVNSGAMLWNANSSTQLSAALQQVFFNQIPCTVTLNKKLTIATACQAEVKLNNVALTCNNATRGWRIVDPGAPGGSDEIELLGTACNDWRTMSGIQLGVEAPCSIIAE